MVSDALQALRELAFNGDPKKTTRSTETDINVFVNEVFVDFGHAIQSDIKDSLEFKPFDELDRKDANTRRVAQSLARVGRFDLKSVFVKNGFQLNAEGFNIVRMSDEDGSRRQMLGAERMDFADALAKPLFRGLYLSAFVHYSW